MLAQVTGNNHFGKSFAGGIVLRDDVVVEAAPLLGKLIGKTRDEVRTYCKRMKWRVSVVTEEPDAPAD